MKKKFSDFKVLISSDHRRDTPGARNAALHGCLFFAAISVILTIFNIRKAYWPMAGTTAFLILGFLAAAILAYKKKVLAADIIIVILCGIIFSGYAISGGNHGFAILWILLIPILGMFLVGLQLGFFLSLYFQIFLIILFYTPLSHCVETYYTETFIMRFPVLYFASFGAVTVLMCQRQQLFNELHKQAYEDALTGLYNRLYYSEIRVKADNYIEYPRLSIVSFDLNRLKYANDTLGHAAGDEMIRASAQLIRDTFKGDLCFRMGGDEFAVISRGDVTDKIETFRNNMSTWKGKIVPSMNISLGQASRSEHPEMSFDELAHLADRNMYADKAAFYRQEGYDRRR